MYELSSVYELERFIKQDDGCVAVLFYAEKHDKSDAMKLVFDKLQEVVPSCKRYAGCVINSISASRAALGVNEVPSVWLCHSGCIQRVISIPNAQLYLKQARDVYVARALAAPTHGKEETDMLLKRGCEAAAHAAQLWLSKRPLVLLIAQDAENLMTPLDNRIVLVREADSQELFESICDHLRISDAEGQHALIVNSKLVELVETSISEEGLSHIARVAPDADLAAVAQCKEIINKHKMVIFMKGTRAAPYCKFTKQLMAILKDANIEEWDYFDVFSDPHIREKIKMVSNWPTFPQIYVKGQLVGGLDTIKELTETHGIDMLANQLNLI